MENHPTTAEEIMLDLMRSYPYMTAEQIALGTKQHLRGVQARCSLLRADEPGEEGRGGLGYIWRVHRRTTKQNTKLAFAFTLSDKSRKHFDQRGKEVVLSIRTPSSTTVDHSLAVTDVLLRARLLTQKHPDKIAILTYLHDRDIHRLKLKEPLAVSPDGLVDFKIITPAEKWSQPTLFEIDMGTEWGLEKGRWTEKIQGYIPFLDNQFEKVFKLTNPTIAVITPTDANRLEQLKKWTEDTLRQKKRMEYAQLFFFAVFTPGMTPEQLFFEQIYHIAGKEGEYKLFEL